MTERVSAAGPVRLLCFALFLVVASGNLPASAQELDKTITLCTSCHGEDGRPIAGNIPIITGQQFYYLYVQLKDFKSGLRANEVMGPIAADLSKDQMKALAQHFSEKDWPRIGYRANDADIAAAESAATAGLCTQCHLGNYQGDSRIPRLAGQQPDYLERTMLDFKNKIRLNSAAKGSLLGAYDDADIKALAHYLAGF